MQKNRRERTALVLQGGGALGSYQAGAFEALQRAGVRFDWVAGISIGALNGAIICGNPPEKRVERLLQFWNETSSLLQAKPPSEDEATLRLFNDASAAFTALFGVPGFFSPRVPPEIPGLPYHPGAVGIYDTSALRQTLHSLVDFDLLNSCGIRFSIGAVNARSGNFQYFDTKCHKIGPEHVMASGALPPGFPPVEINGEYYWDGGIVSNTPLQYVLEFEREKQDYCVFQIDLFSARGELPKTLLEVAQRERDIRYSSRTRLNTDMMRHRHNICLIIKRLCSKIPAELRDDPDWRALEEHGSDAATTIVHLIHRRAVFESASKDYEFSRYTMEQSWSDGVQDVETTLSHPDWVNRTRPHAAVKVFDLTREARSRR